MAFDIARVLSQFSGGDLANVHDSYQAISENAPRNLVSQGLAAMFNSPETPPFGQLAGHLFGNAPPQQQAGMLGQLFSSMGPSVLAALAGRAGGGALGGILGRLGQPGASAEVSPAEATQLTPGEVAQVATHAEQNVPGIVDKMSAFYAQHPELVKTLGAAH